MKLLSLFFLFSVSITLFSCGGDNKEATSLAKEACTCVEQITDEKGTQVYLARLAKCVDDAMNKTADFENVNGQDFTKALAKECPETHAVYVGG